MHPHFYHWHARVELKPETAILESRWNAAAGFAKALSAADICSLLRLIVLPGEDPSFTKRFTEALVVAEPTFPVDHNLELLRVMAAAAVYTQLEMASSIGDALALGLKVAAFPDGRTDPVCQDVIKFATDYLARQSEHVRPCIDTRALDSVEKQVEAKFTALKEAAAANAPQQIGEATEAMGQSVLMATKEIRKEFDKAIKRLSEESQFLWWIISRRSPILNQRRESLATEAYALPAATEAADRVAMLPPAACVESLLDEVLSQCRRSTKKEVTIAAVVNATDTNWVNCVEIPNTSPELAPIAALIAARRNGKELDTDLFIQLSLSPDTKAPVGVVAQQYFRELVFFAAIKKVG